MMGDGRETTDVGSSLEKNYNPLLRQLAGAAVSR